ncbi:hypothetical protein GCM10010517_55540 [Streptosporangium fragile]|uniref:Phospholipase D-like domain-containing protein n=1 Tax=Streptosporangium fragile TaxID=46186 RepID=A0ABN3W697_9ACTN
MWRTLFERAEQRIDILVYAANFLHESWPDLNDLLTAKTRQGCRVRILLGDADSPSSEAEELRNGSGMASSHAAASRSCTTGRWRSRPESSCACTTPRSTTPCSPVTIT